MLHNADGKIEASLQMNSLEEQLFRDANKPGAYQAYHSYLQWLIQKNSTPTPAQQATITSLITKLVPTTQCTTFYHAAGKYWLAKLSSRDNEAETQQIRLQYFKQFIEECDLLLAANIKMPDEIIPFYKEALALFLKVNDIPALVRVNYEEKYLQLSENIVVTKLTDYYTPEFNYKNLRIKHINAMTRDKKISPFELNKIYKEYQVNLKRLLSPHIEMTDTLKIKICFQLITTYIKLFELSGKKKSSYLLKAEAYCHMVLKDYRLNEMYKASIIKNHICRLIYEYRHPYLTAFKRKEKNIDTLVDSHYKQIAINNMHPSSLLEAPLEKISDDNAYAHKLNEAAQVSSPNDWMIDQSQTSKIISTLKKSQKEGKILSRIRDNFSDTPSKVNAPNKDIPYLRALHRLPSIAVVRKENNIAKDRTCYLLKDGSTSIKEIKNDLFSNYKNESENTRLMFNNQQLTDTDTLRSIGIKDHEEITLIWNKKS